MRHPVSTMHRSRRATSLGALAVALAVVGVAAPLGAQQKDSVTGRVVEVRDKNVLVLSVGADAGVKNRQVFEVFEDTKSWSLPFTGGSKVRIARAIVARAVVFSVQANQALARVYEEKGKIETKQYAVLNPVANAPELPPHLNGFKTADGKTATAWRGKIDVTVDATVDPGKRSFCEWRAKGGTFIHGIEVAPGVYRTAGFENSWIAPWEKKSYECSVKVTDASGATHTLDFALESTGGGDAKASAPRFQKVVYQTPKYDGLRDIGFDRKNQCFYLNGKTGFTSDEYLYLLGPDGTEIGSGKVKQNYGALAVNESAIFFLDLDDRSVKRYLRNGGPAQILAADFMKIGEKGEGNGKFKEPIDLAVSADGWLYVLDAGQGCVHCFEPSGEFAYSFGKPGEGEHQIYKAVALALSDDGRVCVLDNGRKKVLVFNQSKFEREFEAGSKSDELVGVAVDNFGGAICVLEKTQGIRRFTPAGASMATATSADERELAFLKKPTRLRSDACRLLHVIDRSDTAFVRFDAGGNGDFVSRSGGEKISTDARLSVAANGDIVILDRDRPACYRIDQTGCLLAKSGQVDGPAQFKAPVGSCVDTDGHVLVVDKKKRDITKFDAKNGSKLLIFAGEAKYEELRDLQFNSHREKLVVLQQRDERPIAVVNPQSGEIDLRIPANGANVFEKPVCGTFSGSFAAPPGSEGTFWVADKGGERVQFFLLNATRPSLVRQDFDTVTGITATPSGVVFVCDKGRKTIEVFSVTGEKITSIKDDQLGEPQDVAADDLGRLYVLDRSKDGRVLLLSE